MIPAALALVLEEARADQLHVDLSLHVPGGSGTARSSVGDLSSETLQAVSTLRALPEVVDVNGAMLSPKIFVTVRPGVSVVDSVALIRGSAALTASLEVITVNGSSEEASEFSVDLTTTWPSVDLTTALDDLFSRGAKYLDANYEMGTTGQAAVNVNTSKPARAVAVLESVSLGPDDMRVTRFSVRSLEEDPMDVKYFDGEVGITR